MIMFINKTSIILFTCNKLTKKINKKLKLYEVKIIENDIVNWWEQQVVRKLMLH